IAATGISSRSGRLTRSAASTPSAAAIRFSQPTETVRVPVSSRPIVCGVVGGTQRSATSCSVMLRARRTSRIRVIIGHRSSPLLTHVVISLSYIFAHMASPASDSEHPIRKRREIAMNRNRLLVERPLPRDGATRGERGERRARLSRSVTVNLAESPLGWLRARGLVSARQHDAAETLRADYERAALAPAVTMRWDASPRVRRRGPGGREEPTLAQL